MAVQDAAARIGGRPPLITIADIVSTGRELGMNRLSINAVAARLGVSATALYRHIGGRWELERLVGESLLADLELADNGGTLEEHLLAFGMTLHRFALENPGLARYMQLLFPRGEAGARLLSDEVSILARRGHTAEAAALLSSSVALVAIGMAAQHEMKADASHSDEGYDRERDAAAELLAADAELGPVHDAGMQLTGEQYLELLLTAVIRGLLTAAQPGRSIGDIVTELTNMGEDR